MRAHRIVPVLLAAHDQRVRPPYHTTYDAQGLLFLLKLEELPPTAERIVMCEAALSGDGDEASIGRYDSVTNRVLSCQVGVGYLRVPVSESRGMRCSGKTFLAHLDVLPDIGFWVDDTHVRLIGAAVDENSVVQLKEAILGIVLISLQSCGQQKLTISHRRIKGRTGVCAAVTALLANGTTKSCSSCAIAADPSAKLVALGRRLARTHVSASDGSVEGKEQRVRGSLGSRTM